MGGLAAGGRVGLKIAACFTAITPEHCLHCSAFIFAATTESREKKKLKKNNAVKLKTEKKTRAAQILSKQKANAKEGGKKSLSAFHFSLRAIVK